MKQALQTQLSNLVFDFLDDVAVFPTTHYKVDVRVGATANLFIEASSEEEALEKAEEEASEITDGDLDGYGFYSYEIQDAEPVAASARTAVDRAKVIAFVKTFAAAIEADKTIDDAMSS